MTGEMRAQALARELRHGLATLAGGGFYRSGEVGFDLQPKQSISAKRIGHDVATPRSLHSQIPASSIQLRQDTDALP